MHDNTRVMIIEDESSFSAMLESFLMLVTVTTLEIKIVKSLADAVRHMESFDPDLIVLDLNLGATGGIETLKLFRELDQATPVIVLAGSNPGTESVFEAGELGAESFLLKGGTSTDQIMTSICCALGRVQVRKDRETQRRDRIETFLKRLETISKE